MDAGTSGKMYSEIKGKDGSAAADACGNQDGTRVSRLWVQG
jgi:hypothetical protein